MQDKINISKKHIYLDYAATTPLDEEVFQAMLPHLKENYGNPSSIHKIGRIAKDALVEARQTIAEILSVSPSEIILTGSGTESDNLAILGLARANKERGNHIIVSSIEHKAVLEPAKKLEKEGFKVTYLPVDKYGLINLDNLKNELRDETILISIMYANNEIGTIEPIKEISTLIKKHYEKTVPPIFHTDACQAVGMLSISPTNLGVDAMTINSSKIYGPKGIGLLYLKKGLKIEPIIIGGEQEDGKRAGTENIALAVGFATALKKIVTNTEENKTTLTSLQKHFLKELKTEIPDLILNGHPEKRLPNNINVCIPNIEGESILLMLDSFNISASTGSACSSLSLEPSYVLRAIGCQDELIHGSVRFSLSTKTTKEDLTFSAQKLGEVAKKLRSMSTGSLSVKSKDL